MAGRTSPLLANNGLHKEAGRCGRRVGRSELGDVHLPAMEEGDDEK